MYRNFFQNRIVLFLFHPVRCIFPVFGGYIPRCAGHTTVFMLRTFQYYLNPVPFTFLCHVSMPLNFFDKTFFPCFFQCSFYAHLVDRPYSGCRNRQFDPAVLFRIKKFLFKQVDVKPPFHPALGVGYMISNNCSLPCYLTNS